MENPLNFILSNIKYNKVFKWGLIWLSGLFVFLMLDYWNKRYYIVIHTVLEMFCILIAFTIFITCWQTYNRGNNISRNIGFGFLIVSIFDMLHTYFFQNPIFDYYYCREITLKFWLLGRITEAVILLMATRINKDNSTRRKNMLISCLCVVLLSCFLVFTFPYQLRMWDTQGLTKIKISLEYFVIIILITALVSTKNKLNESYVSYRYLKFSIFAAIGAELCFTLYGNDLLSYYSLVGHFLRAICYGFIFIGIYTEIIEYPYRKIQSELSNSVNLFSTAFCNAPIGIALLDLNGSWLKINSQLCALINISEADIRYTNFINVFYPDKPDEFFGNLDKLISENQCFLRYKKMITTAQGNIKYLHLTSSLVRDSKGCPLNIMVQVEDITEQTIMDKLIKEQRDQFEAVIENMSDWLIIFDDHGNIIKANKVVKNYLENFSTIKNISQMLKQVVIFDSRGRVTEDNLFLNLLMQGKNIPEHQYTIKSGNRVASYEVNCTPIYDNKGSLLARLVIGHNVTHRLKKEEALLIRLQLNLLIDMIDKLDLGLMRLSYPDYRIIDINHKFYDSVRKVNPNITSLSSIIGEKLCNVYNDEFKTEIAEKIEKITNSETCSLYSYHNFNLSGKDKFYKLMHQPLYGLNEKVIEVVLISIDITDEVEARKQIEQNLKIQEEIFANISHELKTPLNVVFCTNQLMELYLKNGIIIDDCGGKITKNIGIIKQNCYRFTKIINNVVDLSKMESGFFKLNLSNENIVEVIEEIVQSVSAYVGQRRLNIVFDTEMEEKIIACDPDKIERIMLNLISNAIKFTNPGGSIYVNVLEKATMVEISVRDTGIGMDKKNLDNIFNRFHQVDKSLSRNSEGSGIGLSLVKSIVQLHGGRIWADSEPGLGSTFSFELPIRQVQNKEKAKKINSINGKVEMINIEFADIYSVQ